MAQPVPPGPGMDYDPSVTLKSSTVLLSQTPVAEDTSRVTSASARDSVEQGVLSLSYRYLSSRRTRTSSRKIHTGLIEADDHTWHAINLDVDADTIFPDLVYLKRWKDLENVDA